jgi:CubicO group peptidase (beta-lactamase class C family)
MSTTPSWTGVRRTSLVLALVAAVSLAAPITSAAAQATSTPDFAAIDRYVDDQRQAQHVPGLALGIVQDGQVVHLRGYGAADPSGRAVTPQTPFIIGSLTKSVTALAIMQLVESGRIELDAPVQRYVPWFQLADQDAAARITLRHLLYQTSGLPGRAGNEGIANGDTSDGALEREVRALGSVQLDRPVGARHEYSNANYIILGLIVQTVAGQRYEAYVQEHILRPLGMRQSFTSKTAAQAHGLASGHRYWFGVPVPADLPYPRGVLPAGYLIASVEDMARYLAAHQNGGRLGDARLLSLAGMAELLRPGAEAGSPDAFYAMGWSVVQDGDVRVIGHTGETFDFRSTMALVPDRGMGYVLLMNADTALGRGRLTGIGQGVYSLLLGRQVPAAEQSNATLIVYGLLLTAVGIQVAGIARSALLLRRWQGRRERRPRGRWALARHVGLPLVANLAWAGATLLMVPLVLGGSLLLLTLQMPDVGYTLAGSGLIALVWAARRTALFMHALRAVRLGDTRREQQAPASRPRPLASEPAAAHTRGS